LKREEFRPTAVVLTVVLACVLWFVTFYLSWATFWIKISVSAATLAILSLWIQPHRKHQFRFNKTAILLGLASAGVLYVIFWSGKTISSAIMPFAAAQINSIYEKSVGTHTGIIACLLFFITGPCEEIYWRGFLQKNLAVRFGPWQGWLLATVIYAGVHIWSFNLMLIGAAGVAGAFWGAMFWRYKNLAPVIISHSVWSTVIFALFPML
jgi:membrane protease YdiL (CAAX protease family)